MVNWLFAVYILGAIFLILLFLLLRSDKLTAWKNISVHTKKEETEGEEISKVEKVEEEVQEDEDDDDVEDEQAKKESYSHLTNFTNIFIPLITICIVIAVVITVLIGTMATIKEALSSSNISSPLPEAFSPSDNSTAGLLSVFITIAFAMMALGIILSTFRLGRGNAI